MSGQSCHAPALAACRTCHNPPVAISAQRTEHAHGEPATLRSVRSSKALALLVVLGLVAASTVVVAITTPTVPVDAAGVIYLVAVLAASAVYGLWWGIGASVASALAFNFFFLPPAHTFVIDSSSDWAALAAFVATAAVTSRLAAGVRRERDEAARRESEARLSESFATLIAQAPDLDTVLPALGSQAAHALGATDGVIHRGAAAPEGRAAVLNLELNGRRMGELRLIESPEGALDTPAAGRIARSLAGLIALGEERERRVQHQVEADALSRSGELKTALLRAVSHDLRSPLMAITAAAGGLRYANLDEDERELLQTITEQGERMNRMIENLLDLSRLQAGAAAPHTDWLDPRDLVESAIEEVVPAAEHGRVRLRLDQDLPLVRADGSQLQRVLVNILDNALKFSPQTAPVDVSLSTSRMRVEVAVEDAGPGVPEADTERIFEPFSRGEGRSVPGSGLGLAIARGLATANGCTVVVQPGTSGGSRFVLSLPATQRRRG
jgi:two-component system, OmpR family, sensor histidine kinase KdpD